jgi:D-sedoheptulose 7-phosphate isomerase
MTGQAPNPLATLAHEALVIDCDDTATVQELHLVGVHVICEAFDTALEFGTAASAIAEVAG